MKSNYCLYFFQYFKHLHTRLVSYNGRSFDLPDLKYRTMVHGINSPWLHQAGDKWNSYSCRYSSDWHYDLIEELSDYRASARAKLNEFCSIFGLPRKFDVDGSNI